MELGTQAWLDGVRDAVNDSHEYRRLAGRWDAPLALKFEGDGEQPTRYALLHLCDGACARAELADAETYEQAPFAMGTTYERWRKILDHDLDIMRCVVLHRVELRGDRLVALRFLPAAKALLNAAAQVSVDKATA